MKEEEEAMKEEEEGMKEEEEAMKRWRRMRWTSHRKSRVTNP
jgi:hypothetical protein